MGGHATALTKAARAPALNCALPRASMATFGAALLAAGHGTLAGALGPSGFWGLPCAF